MEKSGETSKMPRKMTVFANSGQCDVPAADSIFPRSDGAENCKKNTEF